MSHNQATIVIGSFIGIAALTAILFRNQPHYMKEALPAASSSVPNVLSQPTKSNVTPEFDKQVEQLKSSVKENPSNAAHLIALGRLLMDGHREKDAIPYFEKAALLEPQNDSLLVDLSLCYFDNHDVPKSLEITEKILAFDRDNPRALYNKGAILANQGKFKEAADAWTTLLKRAPHSEEASRAKVQMSQLEK